MVYYIYRYYGNDNYYFMQNEGISKNNVNFYFNFIGYWRTYCTAIAVVLLYENA